MCLLPIYHFKLSLVWVIKGIGSYSKAGKACITCEIFFLPTHGLTYAHTYTPGVSTEELCACVTVFTRLGPVLAQDPDECGLSRASFSLSHLRFYSALTLVLMRRQGLTYIHPFNWN